MGFKHGLSVPRFGLWLKMAAGFGIIIVLGGLVLAYSLRVTMEKHFQEFVLEKDLSAAEELAESLGSYYETYGSWGELTEALQPRSLPFKTVPRSRGPGQGSMGRHMYTGPDIFVIDHKGELIYSSNGREASLPRPHRENNAPPGGQQGKAIKAVEGVVGYVYVGSMIDPATGPLQARILSSMNKSVFFSILIMIGTATIVGVLLLFHITSPIRRLNTASQRVAAGDLRARVKVERKDELGELSASFNAMAASLQRAEEWKTQIIADSAHELRTPVALLHTRLEMLLDSIYPVDKEQITLLYRQTETLTKLLTDLQDLAGMEAGSMKLQKESISLSSMVSQVIENLALEATPGRRAPSIEVKQIPEQFTASVSADPMKIGQVLFNLLTNALRYVPEEGRISVTLRHLKEQEVFETAGVEVAIEDNGPGIPLEERDKIFHRFYRIDPARSRLEGGAGLGLAISSEIIKAHGGVIRAEEAKELTGARILFSLPAAVPAVSILTSYC